MEQLVTHMTINGIISDKQHGFVDGRSCTTQLITVIDAWSDIIDRGGVVDAIYLDFAKAFDTVPHKRLIHKLDSYGVNGNVGLWITDFLNNRRQKVVIGNEESEWARVTSGIPQGSVLGPVLFVTYINDMPDCVSSKINLFADDTKISRHITSENDRDQLQCDLDKLQHWSNKWQLRFNATKCKVMHIGLRNPKFQYTMGNDNKVILEETTVEKDLGVHVDNQLNFSEHVIKAANKANQILGMIRRSITFLDETMLSQLFKGLIRPHLEYGNCVWSPLYKKDIAKIEQIQRRATKMVTSIKELPYEERLEAMKLPSLAYRRLRGDMIEVYKYLHNIYNVNTNQLLPLVHTTSITRGHPLKLEKRRCMSNKREHFFTMRVVNKWNSLPENIVLAPTTNAFKNRLDKHWSKFQYLMEPEQTIEQCKST